MTFVGGIVTGVAEEEEGEMSEAVRGERGGDGVGVSVCTSTKSSTFKLPVLLLLLLLPLLLLMLSLLLTRDNSGWLSAGVTVGAMGKGSNEGGVSKSVCAIFSSCSIFLSSSMMF